MLPPAGMLTLSLMFPVPLASQLAPVPGAQVHEAAVTSAGRLSVTVAPVTLLGPAFATVIV